MKWWLVNLMHAVGLTNLSDEQVRRFSTYDAVRRTFTYPCVTITAVHDGDTLTAQFALGLGITLQRVCRLRGINAPELTGETKALGIASRDFLRGLVLNKIVTIETLDDESDKYGRLLIVIRQGEMRVNDEMIRTNNAVPYMTQ